MKYCNNCGITLDDNCFVCTNCGAGQPQTPYQQYNHQSFNSPSTNTKNSGGFPWNCLGFCMPLLGIVLYFIYKNNSPMRANTLKKSLIAGFIVGIVFTVLYIILLIFLISIGVANSEVAHIASSAVLV